jgi:hypothetical protein
MGQIEGGLPIDKKLWEGEFRELVSAGEGGCSYMEPMQSRKIEGYVFCRVRADIG